MSLEHAPQGQRTGSAGSSNDVPSPQPHLTTRELCARWRCTPETVTRNFRRWGLRPMKIAGAHLWPLVQIEEFERRSMGAGDDAA